MLKFKFYWVLTGPLILYGTCRGFTLVYYLFNKKLRHIYYFEERKVIKAELIFLLMDLLAWDNTEFTINGKSV